MSREKLLEIKNLKKYFTVKGGFMGGEKRVLKAVDDVSFDIFKGETFGLVGESGCGKSTLGRSVTRLYDVTDGQVVFDGTDIAKLNAKALKPFRSRIQMIFQDPYSAINPYMTIREIIREPLSIHTKLSGKEMDDRIVEMLERVGMKRDDLDKFPYEFSGGQRQRIGISRALILHPEFVLCDEPISALDVSIQAQVVNMLEELQSEMGLTYLFVAHDLSMVRHISSRIGVMYLGKIVEVADSRELYSKPLHPYTQALLSAIPIPDPIQARSNDAQLLEGDLPSPLNVPSGCRFRTRCPRATEQCAAAEPSLSAADSGHLVACHLV